LPTSLASLAVEKCYAIAPDCLEVARRWYGVSLKKLVLQSLGTDIDHFHPVSSDADRAARAERRSELGYGDLDIVAIYTGRLTDAKNPAALAGAVDRLSVNPLNIKGLFVGEGGQQTAIENSVNCQVLPFVKHEYLADLYRAADIAVWPTQESMSMLDAASTGLPLIVSNKVGEADRVSGNGKTYLEGSIDDLAQVLSSLASSTEREALGRIGRDKMLRDFSWRTIAESLERDYQRQINVKTAA
jgi:spore coat protein SA